MSDTLSGGKVSVTVSPDTSKFSDELKKGIVAKGEGIGSSLGGTLLSGLKKMAGPIAAVTAAFSLKEVVDQSIEAFEGLAGQTLKTQRLIGGTAAEVSGLTGAMKLSGVNADGAGTALRIFSMKLQSATGDTAKATAMVQKLGTNFLDAHGNLLPMAQLLPAVADKFKNMPDGIAKTALATQLFGRQGTQLLPFLNKGADGIKDLTAKAKEMGLVLDNEGINSFKESAKAQREFKATMEGLQVQIGQALLPVMEAFQDFLRSVLMPLIQSATKFVGEHREEFRNLAKTITADLLPVLNTIGNVIKDVVLPVIGALFKWISENVPTVEVFGAVLGGLIIGFNTIAIATKVWAVAQGILNAVMALNPFVLIAIAIAALVAGIFWLATKTTFFQDMWKNMTNFVSTAWKAVVSFLSDSWKNIAGFFMKYGLDILVFITTGGIGLAIKWIITNWSGIVKFFGQAWNNIVNFFATALGNIVANVSKKVGDIINFFKALPANILKLLATAGTWLLDVGKNIIDGLMTGLKNASGMVGQWFQNMGNAWINQFKSIFGIHSPSKVFHDFGQNIMQGLKDGLVKDEQGLKDTMQKVSNWVTDAFDNGKITAKTAKAATKLISIFTAQLKPLVAAHDAVMKQLDDAQKNLTDKIKERLDYVNSIASKYGASLNIVSKTVDPLAVMQGQDAVASAQADLKSAISDFGSTSREATEASLKLNAAQADLSNTMKGSTTAADVAQQLQDQIAKTGQLSSYMTQLKSLGASGALYQQVLDSGNLEFAKSIIDGGAAAVDQLNTLLKQANAQALALGNAAGDMLYQNGLNVAQAIVDGLTAQESNLTALMDRVASAFSAKIAAVIGSDTTPTTTASKTTKTTAKAAPKASTKPSTSKAAVAAAAAAAAKKVAPSKLALGGIIPATPGGRLVTVAEAGQPEAVIPLSKLAEMGYGNKGPTINYYAAPNQSLDAQEALATAVQRARVLTAW